MHNHKNYILQVPNLHFRTILHQMENGLLWTGLISLSTIEIIEVIRMIFGPLPTYICWFQSFWRNGPTVGCVLFLDANVLFRVIS